MKKHLFLLLMLALPILAFSQNKVTVTGKVTEKSSGEAIIGTTVSIKNEPVGTITSIDGSYSLANVPQNGILVFSLIGMKTVEVPVNGQTTINVSMEDETQIMDEIVIVGYGVQRKSDLTGAISSIKNADINRFTTSNVANSLQGMVSGVFVSSYGAPGSSPEIRIRGVGTVNNTNPLFVVDGMFTDNISFLNNNDILSMEVLKDASATAIYGSQGANGVILITTKKGQIGKTRVNVIANYGIQFENSDFKMANASEYAQLLNEALVNSKGEALYPDPGSLGKGTDWFSEIFRTAPVGDYQVSLSGGSQDVNYNVSAGYFHQDGIIKGNSFNRFTVRANNEYTINKKLKFGHNITAALSSKLNENSGIVASAYRISPIIKPYDDNGNFSSSESGSTGNPLASLEYTNNRAKTNRLVGTTYFNWNPLEGLYFKTSYGIDYQFFKNTTFTPKYYVSEYQKTETNSLEKKWTEEFTWLWENTLTYDFKIKEIHRFNVLGGITAQEVKNEFLKGTGRNLFSNDENYWYLDRAEEESKKTSNTGYSASIMSYLARLNYTLLDKYLLTASFRADGSSKFGPQKRWGYFPSVAVGWRVSEEKFLKNNIDWLSNLKIRSSWGQIGNDKIGNYKYYALANIDPKWDAVFNGGYVSGGTITSLYNENVHWEHSEQFNVGFELGLLKNRFTLEFDYYNRDTKNMLIEIPVPGAVGLTPVETNHGIVRNKGLDITSRWQQDLGAFHYGLRLTATTISNEVISMEGKRIAKGNIGAGKLVTMTEEGKSIGYFYGYNAVGIFQSEEEIAKYNAMAAEKTGKPAQKYQNNVAPGDLIYEDLDGNGFISDADRTDLGSALPKFIGGFGVTLGWNNFDLSIDLQTSLGHKIYNAKQAERYSASDNWDASFLDRWTPENPNTSIPRMTLEGNNYLVSSRYVEDGSYLKLQNIEFGYTLPKSMTTKMGIESLRFYTTGNNLLYFTKYNGFTPEVTGGNLETGIDRTIYPLTATWRFGANITF